MLEKILVAPDVVGAPSSENHVLTYVTVAISTQKGPHRWNTVSRPVPEILHFKSCSSHLNHQDAVRRIISVRPVSLRQHEFRIETMEHD